MKIIGTIVDKAGEFLANVEQSPTTGEVIIRDLEMDSWACLDDMLECIKYDCKYVPADTSCGTLTFNNIP